MIPLRTIQYLFYRTAMEASETVKKLQDRPFQMIDLESMVGPAPNTPTIKTGHAMILNEYGWLWLNRDGTPTLLTEKLYPRLLGDKNTTENRFALQAYLLGGETEFWRAYRRYAGVLQLVYLTASDPKAFTSDEFRDLQTVQVEPPLAKAIEQAFNPLGVYLNFWQPALPAEQRGFTIAMVNDEDRPRSGTLRLSFTDAGGKEAVAEDLPFSLARLGAQPYVVSMKAPATPGNYSLQAIAIPEDDKDRPTISGKEIVLASQRDHVQCPFSR
jgi:beta-galactosidase